jgi:CheY-like chemotaxis protein
VPPTCHNVDDYRDAEQGTIRVFLADDSLIVREGVRALIERHRDLRVVGVAADYDEVVSGAAATGPQVLVTDIRMPPAFQREGIDAAKEVRKRLPAFGLGLSTGEAPAALLGSAERLECTLVGDTVNLSQRLQQLADRGETVLSEGTVKALSVAVDTVPLGSRQVKGRESPVVAYKIACQAGLPAAGAGRGCGCALRE